MATLPLFEHTPLEDIPAIVNGIRATFRAHKSRPLEYRRVQLRKLYWGLHDNQDIIVEACKRDIGKSSFETHLTELGMVMNDIIYLADNLEKFAKDEPAEDVALANKLFGPKIRKDPLGTVLVIGAYNFPIQLSLGPLIGAISAGCTAVLKPSEAAPNAAAVMQKIIAEHLDPTAYTVIQGAIPETTALLDQRWDKIFYTGSANVGTIIAKKAAETLTPVALELGGKNPAIISKNADPRLAARRLLWNKILNAGQVCVSQNYILIDKEILPAFIKEIKIALKEFYPNGAQNSPDYGKIVNTRQFTRLKKMLDETSGKILLGGTMSEKDLFLEPTVVQVDSLTDSLVVDESFGPLIPVFAVTDLDEAIQIANEVDGTPLAIYPFGNSKETEKVLSQVRSGGAGVNDGCFHLSIPTLPFGGVGGSGTGAYHGRASFETFTHRRSITTTPGWVEGLLAIRYPPYSLAKQKKAAGMNARKPNFDRQGKRIGWLKWLVGGATGKPGLGLAVLIFAVSVRLYLQRRSKL
ncbi:aldehyde dehydrogenase [Mytilinidion resinicola]|uniref:Aldehyde dehydrogenase n=1 Tax=Mytilinidion resinicola TaxID=574789 RepID=A0A6A6Y8Z8_9PEZI|nr:aldehyde dehydrogenase [Mytilinidion resinicola]KAF2805028.1 aldehyde dehydrogenase [Mytilinidion resinicola]